MQGSPSPVSSPLSGILGTGSAGPPPPSARVPVRVKYLLSSQWSASATVVHFFCMELRRGNFSVPTQRVIAVTDERAFELDIDSALQRCVDFSRIEGFMLLPREIQILEGKRPASTLPNNTMQSTNLSTLGSPGVMVPPGQPRFNGGVGDASSTSQQPNSMHANYDDPYGGYGPAMAGNAGAQNGGQNDMDLFLQQSDANDFLRTAGALYKPHLSGGSPPLLQLEEGQTLGGSKVLARLREQPLRTAVVDGVSSGALKAICEEQNKQLRAFKEKWNQEKMLNTSDVADMHSHRDALRQRVMDLEQQVVKQDHQARSDRDRTRLQVAQLQEDLHRAREEIKMLKLMRAGGHLEAGSGGQHPAAQMGPVVQHLAPAAPPHATSPALHQLQRDIQDSSSFLSTLRSGSSHESVHSGMMSHTQQLQQPAPVNNVGAALSQPSVSPSPAQPRGYHFSH